MGLSEFVFLFGRQYWPPFFVFGHGNLPIGVPRTMLGSQRLAQLQVAFPATTRCAAGAPVYGIAAGLMLPAAAVRLGEDSWRRHMPDTADMARIPGGERRGAHEKSIR